MSRWLVFLTVSHCSKHLCQVQSSSYQYLIIFGRVFEAEAICCCFRPSNDYIEGSASEVQLPLQVHSQRQNKVTRMLLHVTSLESRSVIPKPTGQFQVSYASRRRKSTAATTQVEPQVAKGCKRPGKSQPMPRLRFTGWGWLWGGGPAFLFAVACTVFL